MRGIINIAIIVLLVAWLIGYIGFGQAVGKFIHLLLVLAIIGILYRLATGKKL